ncbi:hypothetical protein, partial [Xanthomonas perforans]|uniref:hypothetical protein n=1 Tax=Xanthomonas perforans TaxID=442694 RepID=UPI001F48644C
MDHQAGGFVDDGQDIVLVENLQMLGGYAHRRIIRIADTACHCIAAAERRTPQLFCHQATRTAMAAAWTARTVQLLRAPHATDA